MRSEQHFEVVVIGAGIYGAAVSFFLCRQGIKTLLTEEGTVGGRGATAYSGGILRVYDPDPVLAAFSLAGTAAFRHWNELGYPGLSPYCGTGCLYRISPSNRTSARQLFTALQNEGYTGKWLTGKKLPVLFPALRLNAIDEVIWEPDSGYGNPRLAARNLVSGSLSLGGTFFEWCRVSAFERTGDRWMIFLPQAAVTADILVIACGAYTGLLLPGLAQVTRSISLLQLTSGKGGKRPDYSVVDEITGTYIRPLENGGFYTGSGFSEEKKLPSELGDHTLEEIKDAIGRLERLVHQPYRGGLLNHIRGFDAYTPGKRPIACFLPGYENLFLATGFSGRGFKMALPLAEGMALKIANRLGRSRSAWLTDARLSLLFDEFTP